MTIVVADKYMFRGGGTAAYLFALSDELARRGHEIIPFTVAYEQTVPTNYSEFYVSPLGSKNATHLRDLSLNPWAALRLLGRATWSLEAYRKALALVDASKPDIAYVHNLYSYMSPSPIAAFKRRGLPVVMRVPDMNMVCPGLINMREGRACLECIDRGLWWAVSHRCHKGSLAGTLCRVLVMSLHRWAHVYRSVDLFVTPSQFMRQVLLRTGISEDRVVHIPSFCPFRETREKAKRASGASSVVYFGRVSAEKGLDLLIRAARDLPEGVEIRIAGGDRDGEMARLQALAMELGVRNVRFLGFQPPEALQELIADCLFTVVPSRWHDNCPMAVLESFAQAKPVVGANVGGIPEQIREDSGLLFEPGNAADLSSKMGYMLTHPQECARMGAAALERVRTVYSPNAHCERLLGELERVIHRHRLGEEVASVDRYADGHRTA